MADETAQKYSVVVKRDGETKAVAQAREHVLVLNAAKGQGTAGFNAAETLMASLGVCLMTNLNALSKKMHLRVDDATVEIDALRFQDPPGIVELSYTLTLVSPEPQDKLEQLHDLSVKWGTVTNTLISGVQPVGFLRVKIPQN